MADDSADILLRTVSLRMGRQDIIPAPLKEGLVVTWFMHLILVVAGLVVVWRIFVTFTVISECQPVGSYSQPLFQQHRLDTQKFYWAKCIFNLLLDVKILCLPIPMIWRLQISLRSNLSVTVVFTLGALYGLQSCNVRRYC